MPRHNGRNNPTERSTPSTLSLSAASSDLGPPLRQGSYLAYYNSLFEIIETCSVYMYPDDTQLYNSFSRIEDATTLIDIQRGVNAEDFWGNIQLHMDNEILPVVNKVKNF
ncbi:hypothetical protein Trydic_g10580 [Trypoxylus dichotomus]